MSSVRLQRLVPMLPVRSMPASVEFYEKLLGFSVETRNDEWGWAMLGLCDCRLMVDQSLNVQPDAPRQTILYLYPQDVVKYHEQVRRNYLAQADGDRARYRVIDAGQSVERVEEQVWGAVKGVLGG